MNKMCWVWSVIKREQCPEQTLPSRKPTVKGTQTPVLLQFLRLADLQNSTGRGYELEPSLHSILEETGQQGSQATSRGVSWPWLLCPSFPTHQLRTSASHSGLPVSLTCFTVSREALNLCPWHHWGLSWTPLGLKAHS